MRLAPDGTAYLADPLGSWTSGRASIVFCRSARLSGLIVWDDPKADDARGALAAMEADLRPGVEPHAFLVDARRLTDRPDPDAFAAVIEYMAPRRSTSARSSAAPPANRRPPGAPAEAHRINDVVPVDVVGL